MTIYMVNGFSSEPTYFDDTTNQNAKTEVENLLLQKQQEVLISEASRFSICATFVNGNDTTWREIEESDPEETICQVFDTFTGTYTQCNNKTEAYNLNKQKQQAFLASIRLDKVYEVSEIPVKPKYGAAKYGETVGDIPVEVM